MGLWDSRVTIESNDADPTDKARGVWNAHVKAWNNALDRKCERLLVFESDVFFDHDAFAQSAPHVDAFLKSNQSYDMFFLGYGARTWIAKVEGVGQEQVILTSLGPNREKCIYHLSM